MPIDTLKTARRLEKSMSDHIRRKENGSATFYNATAAAAQLMAESRAAARRSVEQNRQRPEPRQQ